MSRNIQFPDLLNHILQVSSTKRAFSSPEIRERIKKYYEVNCAPSPTTVYRAIQTLIKRGDMYENDSNFYLKKESYKLSLKPFMESVPRDILWQELAFCLAILADDPIEHREDVISVVKNKIRPDYIRMQIIMDLIDQLIQSPEIMAHAAHSNTLVIEHLKGIKNEWPDYLETWKSRYMDTFGGYILGAMDKKETP